MDNRYLYLLSLCGALLWAAGSCAPSGSSGNSPEDPAGNSADNSPEDPVGNSADNSLENSSGNPDGGNSDNSSGDSPGEPGLEALPDFSVPDVNPASASYGDDVSPRDYLGQISAWYFGHAT